MSFLGGILDNIDRQFDFVRTDFDKAYSPFATLPAEVGHLSDVGNNIATIGYGIGNASDAIISDGKYVWDNTGGRVLGILDKVESLLDNPLVLVGIMAGGLIVLNKLL